MLVEGPGYLSCPIHELRSMAAACAPVRTDQQPAADQPIQLDETPVELARHTLDLTNVVSRLMALLPTPEPAEPNDRLEPNEGQRW